MFQTITKLFNKFAGRKTMESNVIKTVPEMLIELRQKGYTQKQMSQELDIPVNKVKSESHKLLRNGKIERKTNRIKVKNWCQKVLKLY